MVARWVLNARMFSCWVSLIMLVLPLVSSRPGRRAALMARIVRQSIPEGLPRLHSMVDPWYLANPVPLTRAQENFFLYGHRAGASSSSSQEYGRRRERGDIGGMKIRKEYRSLTEEERERFLDAVKAMMHQRIDGMSEYDIFASQYRGAHAPGAYFGAASLPWHRQFLSRFEEQLQYYYPTVTLPYWDSTLDAYLPVPSQSVIFGIDLFGVMADWSSDVPDCQGPLVRNPTSGNENLPDDDYIYHRIFGGASYFRDIASFTDNPPGDFEETMAGVYVFLGGNMKRIYCAATDPIFLMHRAFVDYLWEEFRQEVQISPPEEEYPSGGYIGTYRHHAGYAPMRPFEELNLFNIDGLRSDFDYHYEVRQKYCDDWDNCASDFLWCDIRANLCRTKIGSGGVCGSVTSDACYGDNQCRDGRCTPITNSYYTKYLTLCFFLWHCQAEP